MQKTISYANRDIAFLVAAIPSPDTYSVTSATYALKDSQSAYIAATSNSDRSTYIATFNDAATRLQNLFPENSDLDAFLSALTQESTSFRILSTEMIPYQSALEALATTQSELAYTTTKLQQYTAASVGSTIAASNALAAYVTTFLWTRNVSLIYLHADFRLHDLM